MAKAKRTRWGPRSYRAGHRWLGRAGLERVFDYRWCEILGSSQPLRPVSAWNPESFWLGELPPAQLDCLAAFAPQRAEEFPARWAEGRRCFAALLEPGQRSQCVGYVWMAVGPTRLETALGWTWELPARTAWLYDALSHPLIPGTYPDLMRYADAQVRREGCAAVLGQVEFDNPYSRRVHRRLGAEPSGWILSLRLGGVGLRLERQRAGRRWRPGAAPVRLAAFLPTPAVRPAETAPLDAAATGGMAA